MGILKDYMAQRRHKKLEEINRALEQLKHENVATDALKPKISLPSSTSYPPMRNGKDLMFIGILLVAVVVLVIFSFYSRTQFSKLQDEYQQKVDALETLEADLEEKREVLEETQKDKETTEKDLLRDRNKLEAEIEDLEKEISALQADVTAKRNELDNLTRTVSDQRREIDRWKDCIEDELNENLSVCD